MTAVLSQVVFIMKVDNQAIETILMPRESGNFCHFFDGRGIVANPRTEGRFNKSYYGDLSEVIWEFLTKFLEEKVEAEDRFVIASDLRHNKHLFDHLPADNTKILTWFAERNQDDSI